jgi:hypothetical protein
MKFRILSLIIASLIPFIALGGEGESIILDPVTGNYVITHFSDSKNEFERIIYVPATKINPQIRVGFNGARGDIIRYRYKLRSGNDSKQAIVGMLLDPVSSVATPMPDVPLNAPPGAIMSDMRNVANYFEKPASWKSMMAYSSGQMAFRISWYFNADKGGLFPGGQADFGFSSRDLPGIIQARVDGYAPDSQDIDGEAIPDDPSEPGDDPFWKQYFALTANNFVRRPVAVPTIAIPAPFDAVILLDRIRTEMQTWPGQQLLDAAYAAKLDGLLASAANAYRLNQPKAAKEHIETIRKMLAKEHHHIDHDDEDDEDTEEHKKAARFTIDRLAARVLDLDLRYVLKRTERDHEDHEQKKH